MSENQSTILLMLERNFAGRAAISRGEFRKLLNISISADARLKREGVYPVVLNLTPSIKTRCEGKILLTDLAAWLEDMQAKSREGINFKKPNVTKKLGRPVGSKNKPKETKSEETFTL